MLYSALEIAEYVITVCTQRQKPLSNLKLQKILYFIWVDYFRMKQKYVFFDEICAWQLGPVVPTVYYEYCSYAGRPICNMYQTEILDEDQNIINTILDNYIDVPASALVERTHQNGTAWDQIYRNGEGNRKVIPFPLIISKEVG